MVNETKQEKQLRAGIDYVTTDAKEVENIRTVKAVSGMKAGEFNRMVFALGMEQYKNSPEFKKIVARLKALV